MKQKKKKLVPIKSLQRKVTEVWKSICFIRDGRECQVKKYFPAVKVNHCKILQVDHCFSRGNKNLFLEPANGTVVCASCNLLKSFKKNAIDKLIDIIVLKREGEVKFNLMLNIAMRDEPNRLWTNREWLVNKISFLTQFKEGLVTYLDGVDKGPDKTVATTSQGRSE